MKELTIDGKKYTLEYTIGASLYDDCVTSVMRLMASLAYAETIETREMVNEQINIMGGVPKVTLTVFYAGLLEHHGTGELAGDDSDETVPDMKAARKIVQKYLRENKGADSGSWMDIFNLCLACMGDDDFLTLIGIDKMMDANIPATKKRGRQKKETIEA